MSADSFFFSRTLFFQSFFFCLRLPALLPILLVRQVPDPLSFEAISRTDWQKPPLSAQILALCNSFFFTLFVLWQCW